MFLIYIRYLCFSDVESITKMKNGNFITVFIGLLFDPYLIIELWLARFTCPPPSNVYSYKRRLMQVTFKNLKSNSISHQLISDKVVFIWIHIVKIIRSVINFSFTYIWIANWIIRIILNKEMWKAFHILSVILARNLKYFS